ncbi:MAG: HEAT repeat domain-containing protein [Planctomycetota bacterium]|jgi:HEAT repeat protein|nr:HEAT repeat domain-containing protein [Planctomycetota bacterium]MDP7130635.1 HEAT repeat domain-containing protein [Planctomycetota bacterium]
MKPKTDLQSAAILVLLAGQACFFQRPVSAEAVSPAGGKVNPVPQLLRNLESLDEHVSSNAARSLGIVFTSRDTGKEQLQKVVDALIEKMKDGRWTRLRLECIAALGVIRARKAADALQEIMRDENVSIAMAAGKAAGQILHSDAARALLKKMGKEESESVQRVVYKTFADLATQGDVEFLIRGLGSSNWRVQVDAMRGIERAAREGARLKAEVYEKVGGLLGNEIANVAQGAMHVLVHVRSADSLNTLKKAAEVRGDGSKKDTSWRTRTYALKALRQLQLPTIESCLPVVIRQLDDPTSNVLNEARGILNAIRTNRHYFRVPEEQVAKAAADYLYPRFLAELEQAESLGLREKIIKEMGTAVTRRYADRVARAAANSLTDSMKDKTAWKLRDQALALLGTSGAARNEAATTEALKALKQALETGGEKEVDNALPQSSKTTNEPETSWRVRAGALQALLTIGYPTNRELLPLVIRQLEDTTANVLNPAREIIHRARRHRGTESYLFSLLLNELESAKTERLKAKILAVMGDTVPSLYASRAAKAASDALADSLEKPQAWELRTGAIALLGASGTTADIETIARCVSDDSANVRRAAGKALERLSELCEETEKAKVISALQPLIVKIVDWRKTAIAAAALGHYPTPEAVESLVKLLGHSVVNIEQAASGALVAFVNSGDRALKEQVEKALLPVIQSEDATWEYGAPVLGALKTDPTIPLLVTIINKGKWRAQVNAINAVIEIASKIPLKDRAVSDAIIRCSNSRVRQVNDAANQALRMITPEE